MYDSEPSVDPCPGIRPYLCGAAVARRGTDALPGYYSEQKKVWVVLRDGVELPLISLEGDLPELATKTAQQMERDDFRASSALIELVTKTEARPERDDK